MIHEAHLCFLQQSLAIISTCKGFTFCSGVPFRIEILEYKNIILALFAHVVVFLLRVMHQVHGRAGIVPSDVICFHKIIGVHSTSVAYCQWPVFHRFNEGPPDTGSIRHQPRNFGQLKTAYLMMRTRPFNR